jgi:flagella basal body P-ring formation protein FlgA
MKPLRPPLSRVHGRARSAHGLRIVPLLLLCLATLACAPAQAQAPGGDGALDTDTLQRIQALGEQASAGLAPGAVRVEIEPGRIDPRLRLAPCERIEPYLPPGARVWGRSRIGLRCVQGPTAWTVYLPVTVKVFAPAWVVAVPLAAGSMLDAGQLQQAEVDWAAAATPPVADAAKLVGRQLARPLTAGAPVRVADLKQRQWFAAGDMVQLVARGNGFSVSGEGQAMSPGIEGQTVRVRTDNGRVLTGQAVGQNRVEVQL